MFRRAVAFVVLISLTACAPDPPPRVVSLDEPLAQQLLRAAPFLKDARYSTLLSFETPDDALFVTVSKEGGAIAVDRAFTGHKSYRIEPSAPGIAIKLSSLLAGRPFPGNWCMIGSYVFATQPTRMTIRLGTFSADVDLIAGTWTPVFLDLPVNAPIVPLEFLPSPGHGQLWFDDVMLVDNQKSLLTEPTDAWTIDRRGTQINGKAPGQFNFSLTTSDVVRGGWTCDEVDPMRARFHTADGRTLTVYSDGRAFNNGVYKPMTARVGDAGYALQNQHPATIEIADNMGRVDRNTPGDANNDGYNETTGSYRIIAQSPRIEFRFVPARGTPDPRPVLEISGLPFGKVLATLEGRLIEGSQRAADGSLLLELPATIDRAATVDVRVEN